MQSKWLWIGLVVLAVLVTGCKQQSFAIKHNDLPEPCKTFLWQKYSATSSFNGDVILSPESADTLFLNVTQLKYCYLKAKAVIKSYNERTK